MNNEGANKMEQQVKQAMVLAGKETMKVGHFMSLMDCFQIPEDAVTEEMLNECYEPIKVCGYEYEQGSLLKAIDPIAFRQAVCEHLDYLCTEGIAVEIDGDFYMVSDINEMIERIEKEYA